MKCLDYISVSTLDEALCFLKEHPENTVPAAGGTDLMVKARNRDWYENQYILDLSGIDALQGIREEGDLIRIGAITTIRDLLDSPLIEACAGILREACLTMGGPQIRNRATIGGNLANGCLAADMIPPLCVLRAEIEVVSPAGSRKLPVSDLLKKCPACLKHEHLNPGGCYYGITAGKKTVLASDELITEISFAKMDPDYVLFFQKLGDKAMGCMSRFTLAAALKKQDEQIADLRLCLGSAFSDIKELTEAESRLMGAVAGDPVISEVAEDLAKQILAQQKVPADDLRSRSEICRRLLPRTIREMMA